MDARPENKNELERLSDLELVARINHGDEAAFEVVYHRHKDWVVNLAWRWTGDRDLALDVLQETFLYFAKKFPGFRLTARLQTFFYPAVRNLAIAARRKAWRYHASEAEKQQLTDAPASEKPVDSREELTAALAILSEEHREVLLLRFVDGLELREIALAMEIPLGTVKSRLHHALDTLRNDGRTKKHFEQ